MTTVIILLVLLGVFAYMAVRSTYYIMKFFAGAMCWALAIYCISNPIAAVGNPLNDFMQIVLWLAGIAIMVMAAWQARSENGKETGGFNLRVPKFLGGKTEEEENEAARNNSLSMQDRNRSYINKVNNALNNRRGR